MRVCTNCGKELNPKQVRRKQSKHIFCSTACRKEYVAKNARANTCANCGKIYKKRYGNTHCCSTKCRDEWKLKAPHHCHLCGVLLERDVNWKPKGVCPEYACITCRQKLQVERTRRHRIRKRDTILQSTLHSSRTNGRDKRWNHVGKRPYPETCEICGKPPKNSKISLHWHHWNDEHPEIGLWLCQKCHIKVNAYETNQKNPDFINTYLTLKNKMESLQCLQT